MQEDKSKRGRSARNKGANGERELANLLRDMWGYDVRRGYVFNGESDLVGLKGIHPEVKRHEQVSMRAWLEQGIKEAQKRKDGVPTVFFRWNRGEWLVTMRLEDWIDLYGAWIDEG